MKYFFSFLFVLATAGKSVSAQNHFIFIQSENKKPFSVSVNDKKLNSTAVGYVIIPRLKSGQHEVFVKMLEPNSPEVKFTANIDKKDVGYTLRNLNSNVALVNMQTYSSISGTMVETFAKNETKNTEKSTIDVPKTSKPEKDIVKNPSQKETVAPANPVAKLKKGINKISEIKNDKNVSLVFIDVRGDEMDTIDVIIPRQNDESFVPASRKFFQSNSFFNRASQIGMEENWEIDQAGYNTTCVHLLTKDDLARLRRKMSAETSEDGMIEEAVKAGKTKCFTTADVRKLSALFNKDQGKLKFFNELYSKVYDYIAYPELETELTDSAIKSKFRSLLQK